MTRTRLPALMLAGAVLALLGVAPGTAHETSAGTAAPPPNDDFADATVVASLPYRAGPVDMSGATLERDEPRSTCAFPEEGTVWYRVTPDEDAALIASSTDDDRFVVLTIWTEQRGELAQVACSEYRLSRVVARVEAGRTYSLQVGIPFGDTTTPLTLEIVDLPLLANDDFVNANLIDGLPFSDAVSTDAATRERGEPRTCIGGKYAIAPDSTLWYAFTSHEDMTVVVDTAGSDFDTVLAVWTPGQFGLEDVACASVFNLESLEPARLAFRARADQAYYIQVGGVPYTSPSGQLVFNVTPGVAPPNDDFAGALDITNLPFDHTVDTLAATREPGEPTPTCAPGGTDTTAWYRLNAAIDSIISVEAEAAAFFPVVGVYAGTSLGDLQQVSCGSPWYPGTSFAFQASAGETYYLQVGVPWRSGPPLFEPDAAGQPRGVTIHLTAIPVPPCPPPESVIADRSDDVAIWLEPPEPGRRHDILSTGVSATDEYVCIRTEFAEPVAPPDAGTDDAVEGLMWLDNDSRRDSGYGVFACGSERLLGVDAEISLYGGFGLRAPIYLHAYDPPPPDEPPSAMMLFEDRAMTIIVPNEVVGSDGELRFVMRLNPARGPGEDCAPDSGIISRPPPAFGDANCDGAVDSRDSVMILQFFARLTPSLPCEYVADANGNGTIGSIDAALILQYSAGLISVLPGEARDAVAAAVQATAEREGISKELIRVEQVTRDTWPDGCLGLAEPGEVCTLLLVPGYRIVLSYPFGGTTWRTDLSGAQLRVENSFIV